MRYNILQQAIKEIVESHKADIKYFSGLEEDFDPSQKVNYPAIVFTPPAFDLQIENEPEQKNQIWKLHFESQEMLSTAASTTKKQEALDRTAEYLKDVVLEFIYTYGYDNKTVTIDNITETLDFEVTSTLTFLPFIDVNDSVTGWQIDLEIKEARIDSLCHLPDVFN